ncbi:Succinyl-diaminopimelate desuccinylase, partial [Dissostichus eleginoides]
GAHTPGAAQYFVSVAAPVCSGTSSVSVQYSRRGELTERKIKKKAHGYAREEKKN